MTLFIRIKKIISYVLLLCVLVSVVPVETFAQTTPAVADMSAYAGWDTVSAKAGNASVPKSKYSTTVGNFLASEYIVGSFAQLNDVQLDYYGKEGGSNARISDDYYYALLYSTGGLKNPLNYYKPFEKSKISVVGTNNGKVAYYYTADKGNPVLIAYATAGKVFTPPAGFVTKELTPSNPLNKDLSTQQGLLNSIDQSVGNRVGDSYSQINNIEELKSLQQEQERYQIELAAAEKKLQEDNEIRDFVGPRNDGKTQLSTTERSNLEKTIANLRETSGTVGARTTQAKENSQSNTIDIAGKCDPKLFSDSTFFTSDGCVITLLAILANFVLKLSALVLYWTGNLFDYSIEIAVNSAEFLKRINIVEPTWAFVRDALNMTFIFILLFVATQILLGKGNYSAKGSVARLVLVAILINFSLFAAKVMVDGSNVISLNIYEAIKYKEGKTSTERGNVSARIMTTLGLSGVYNFGAAFDNKTVPGCNGAPGTILTVGIFGSIMIIITSLTFLLMALLFFLRMLNIIVLFISSPIWVWGHVMNNETFKSMKNRWWEGMKNVLVFPVIFMLMLYVSLAMFAQLNSSQINQKDGTKMSFIKIICDTSLTNGQGVDVYSKLPLILNFILVIAAMILIIKYSVNNAGKGGMPGTSKLATNISSRFDNIQKKFTTGAAQAVYNKSTGAVMGAGGAAKSLVYTPIKEQLKNITRKKFDNYNNTRADALEGRILNGNYTERQKERMAKKAEGLRDRVILKETQKDAIKRRTAAAGADAEILEKVRAEQFKVENEKAWRKKNPEKTGVDDYYKYEQEKTTLIAKSRLKGIVETVGLGRGKGKDGADQTNEEYVREKAFEDVLDDKGNATGKKKLNQEKLHQAIQDVHKHHEDTGTLPEGKMRFELLGKEKAKVRAEKAAESRKKLIAEAKKKQGESASVEKKKAKIKDSQEQLGRLPENLDNVDKTTPNKYHSSVASYIKELESIESDMQKSLTSVKDPVDEQKIKDAAKKKIELLENKTREKVKKERDLLDNSIEKNQKEIDAFEAKEEKKDDKK